MGQQISSHSGRRRLPESSSDFMDKIHADDAARRAEMAQYRAKWQAEEASNKIKLKKLEFRPFGGYNYSYTHKWMRTASFTIWALVTLGSLAVDWREALAVLGGSLWAQETIKNDPLAMGASWVHNVQAGYCLYHYWMRNNRKLLVELAVAAEGAADLTSFFGPDRFDDWAHVEGLGEGLIAGFVLDKFVFKTKQPLFKVQY